ncbi:F-box only protein 6-like [Petromyzon marinus]|uniref:F-box only protein 6-like n=1 Tax=Petromyzon marinus TaxID=7757 RepID=A0AAJ7UBD9_PETMA|nr:F-box only protein 6-like [Petromyzon marinus]XP_032833185.1 F-box only protein 6-like [Petromyzon marinus]
MGQSATRPTVPRPEDMSAPCPLPLLVDLSAAPDDVLLEILSWVPEADLSRHCRAVCSAWLRLVDSGALWKLKCRREGKWSDASCCRMPLPPAFDWRAFYLKGPFSRNLLQNPCATNQFDGWHITSNGGDHWNVEDVMVPLPEPHAHITKSFVSSYNWCGKEQVVSLLAEGLWVELLDEHQPHITVSDWYAARWDCGCVYELSVTLLAEDKSRVLARFDHKPKPIPQWSDACWNQVSHVFRDYGPGVRYLRFEHSGKDTQFWAGWYGARMTNSSVTVGMH